MGHRKFLFIIFSCSIKHAANTLYSPFCIIFLKELFPGFKASDFTKPAGKAGFMEMWALHTCLVGAVFLGSRQLPGGCFKMPAVITSLQ